VNPIKYFYLVWKDGKRVWRTRFPIRQDTVLAFGERVMKLKLEVIGYYPPDKKDNPPEWAEPWSVAKAVGAREIFDF